EPLRHPPRRPLCARPGRRGAQRPRVRRAQPRACPRPEHVGAPRGGLPPRSLRESVAPHDQV
ncbi:MAG: hypothetical protein AVDCRST_MAG45-2140, partial [uncultured Solirubrobacterales bacterium]